MNNKGTLFNIIFREKPTMMLLSLNNNEKTYASIVAKQVDCTYSHVVKILQEMEQLGIVTFEKQGRLKLLKLTKKGEEIASFIEEIRKRIY